MKLTLKDIVVFGMFGALIYGLEFAMKFLPNIHLTGVFTVALTAFYRKKALFPIYVYVFINGVFSGFTTWWIPYLYIWTILWGMTMLIPKSTPDNIKPYIYTAVCALHGILFGVLYAPAQALLSGLSFKGMISWIISGLPFDITHCIGNLCCSVLIIPIIKILKRIN